ncbi:M12 family metallopeptidase (plasmid) [Aquincola tertiaricarbonis]|uniref:M12 family metallopeptidase n=1 Tax=Aquincola tertiaricarbonis TaxID=391953 RepID=A0ABY4SIL1_AQUTE|nr:M12 family metallopeptidase [Aquincola tertiaricarbonis]URI11972.1 M12 family metallopeptidase [Aquincola tertiaricarbonis]
MQAKILFISFAAALASGLVWSQSNSFVEPDLAEGLPEHLLYLYSGSEKPSPEGTANQLFASLRRWEPGRRLRVCYFQGNAGVASLIQEVASEWNKHSSVKFDFGDTNGKWPNCLSPSAGFFEVRIGFNSAGYWSMIGTDSETRFSGLQPSMNFEGFNRTYFAEPSQSSNVVVSASAYHRAIILHEFGHALGLLHEQQNPSLKCHEQIKWTGPGNVYEYYKRPPNRWEPETVDRNFGFIWQFDPDFVGWEDDVHSIMMYDIPPAILKSGINSNCASRKNHELSKRDIKLVATIYPAQQGKTPVDLPMSSSRQPPVASATNAFEAQDTTRRIVADLQSDDAFTRRNARLRLATVLPVLPSATTTSLVDELLSGDYRQKLGLAAALANTPKTFQLPNSARAQVSKAASVASDPILKKQLQLANKPKLQVD